MFPEKIRFVLSTELEVKITFKDGSKLVTVQPLSLLTLGRSKKNSAHDKSNVDPF